MRHLLLPLAVAATVREDGDATATQAVDLLRGQPAAACRSQPQIFRLAGRHDECSLLALHQTHMGIGAAREQMLAEEALVQLPVGWQQTGTYQRRVRPSLKAVAVAVDTILHDVAAVHQALLVYLPEDDVPATGGSDEVVLVDLLKLLLREVQATGNIRTEPLPEDALPRVAAQYILHREGHEWGQRDGLAMAFGATCRFACPLVVLIIIRGFVVVAAGVLVVALSHAVVHIAEAVLGIHIAHQALLPATVRTGEFTGLTARQALAL